MSQRNSITAEDDSLELREPPVLEAQAKSADHIVDFNPKDEDDYSRQLRNRFGTSRSNFHESLHSKRTPTTIAWNNLQYEIPGKRKKPNKTILQNNTGCVKPGQLLAIMGSSGAGKTSLLNVLAGRASGNVSGDIKVNGVDVRDNKKYFKLISGYVMQDDTMLANLTVRETLMFSASMRLPSSISQKEKEERVSSVIQELGLVKCADSKIGSVEKRGISGGERKRVNIGIELITDPSLLFLDEPTSGLDAFTSYSIMETLIGLAEAGRTVICTIHQPRSNIFKLFDVLLLLSQGQVVYFGPAQQAVNYFSKLNFECPKFVNPADFFLDIISIDQRDETLAKETEAQALKFIEAYKASDEAARQSQLVEEEIKRPAEKIELPYKGGFPTTYWTQFALLFDRSFKNFYREKFLNFIRGFQTLVFAIIIGLIYLRMDNDQSSIYDRAGVLFFILVNQGFTGINAVLGTFATESAVFKRERASRTYRVSPYYLTKAVSELPGQFIFPIVFCVIVYWMIGLNPAADRFFIFIGITLLLNFTATSLGQMISAITPNITAANILAPMFLIIMMLFGGYYINLANIPIYFVWLQYISFMKYGFIAMMLNEFQGLELRCKDSQYIEPGHVCPVPNGDIALKGFDMDGFTVGSACGALIAISFFFRIVGYIGIRLRKP